MKLKRKAIKGRVVRDAESVHYYENAKSVDVYVWTKPKYGPRYCTVVRLRRADLADYVKRSKPAKRGGR